MRGSVRDEAVLARLAAGTDPFLGPHHLEAARRFEALATERHCRRGSPCPTILPASVPGGREAEHCRICPRVRAPPVAT